jgi:16S rRNA (guanine527-N7)-methyltransferase
VPADEGVDLDALVATLAEAQRLGFLGARDLREVVDHARGYATALADLTPAPRPDRTGPGAGWLHIVDLGAGGGVPGLIIALDRPDARLTLIDRRAKRTDFLLRAVRRHGWHDRVEVVCDDVDNLIRRHPNSFDAAVARGFGPPDVTLDAASRLIAAGGRIVISEPPVGNRWDVDDLADRGLVHRNLDGPGGRLAVFDSANAG